jgi:hypothetical protein
VLSTNGRRMASSWWIRKDAGGGDIVFQVVHTKRSISTGRPGDPKNVFSAIQELKQE